MKRTDSIVVLNDDSELSSCEESWTGINSNDMDRSLDQGCEINSVRLLSESNYSNNGLDGQSVDKESDCTVHNRGITNSGHSGDSPSVTSPFDTLISSISSCSQLPEKQTITEGPKVAQSLSTQTPVNSNVTQIFGYPISKPYLFIIIGIVCALFMAFVQIVHYHWVTTSFLREQMTGSNSRVGQELSALIDLLKQKESSLQETTTEFERTKLDLNELLNDFSVLNVKLEAKTTAYTKLNSEYETLKNKVKSLHNDLLRVSRQLHEKEAAYNNMLSEHERVKDTMSALLTEIKRLKMAFEEVRYSSIFIPGIKVIRKTLCRILKLCPHLENM